MPDLVVDAEAGQIYAGDIYIASIAIEYYMDPPGIAEKAFDFGSKGW